VSFSYKPIVEINCINIKVYLASLSDW